MDEAALFYQMLPNFSFFLSSKRNIHGIKQSKNRLTSIFCCNMTGTIKIPVTIIGKHRTPYCFNRGRPPIPYINTSNGWINSKIFILW